MFGQLPAGAKLVDHGAAGCPNALPNSRPDARRDDAGLERRSRNSAPMRFVRLVAAEKIKRPVAALDRPANRRQMRQMARLIIERFRGNARLIGIDDSVAGQMIFGRRRPGRRLPANSSAVRRRPASARPRRDENSRTAPKQSSRASRDASSGVGAVAPAHQGLLELIRFVHPMNAGPAAAEKIAIQCGAIACDAISTPSPNTRPNCRATSNRQQFIPGRRWTGIAVDRQMNQQPLDRQIVAWRSRRASARPSGRKIVRPCGSWRFRLRAFREPFGQAAGDDFFLAVGAEQARDIPSKLRRCPKTARCGLATRSVRHTKAQNQATLAARRTRQGQTTRARPRLSGPVRSDATNSPAIPSGGTARRGPSRSIGRSRVGFRRSSTSARRASRRVPLRPSRRAVSNVRSLRSSPVP